MCQIGNMARMKIVAFNKFRDIHRPGKALNKILMLPLLITISCNTFQIGSLFIDDTFRNTVKSNSKIYVLPTIHNTAWKKFQNSDSIIYSVLREKRKNYNFISPAETLKTINENNLQDKLEVVLKKYASEDSTSPETIVAMKDVFHDGYILFSWVTEFQPAVPYSNTGYYPLHVSYGAPDMYFPIYGSFHHSRGHMGHHGRYPYHHGGYYWPYDNFPYRPVSSGSMGGSVTVIDSQTGKRVFDAAFKGYYGYGDYEDRVRWLFSEIVVTLPEIQ